MNFRDARINMVEQQVRPWEVLNTELLEILTNLPREEFTLPEERDLAYAEITLKLANGGVMLDPKIIARLIQALDLGELNKKAEVLEIGTGSGYSTAVLAQLAGHVDTFDCDPEQSLFAQRILNNLGLKNIQYLHADGLKAENIQKLKKQYDAIYLGGAVREIPRFLIDSLKPQGKLVAIVGKTPIMRATLVTQNNTALTVKTFFDTHVPYLTELDEIDERLHQFNF